MHGINLHKWVGRPVAFNLQNPNRKKIQMYLTYSIISVIQDLIAFSHEFPLKSDSHLLICFNESSLKMMKNTIFFHVESCFHFCPNFLVM